MQCGGEINECMNYQSQRQGEQRLIYDYRKCLLYDRPKASLLLYCRKQNKTATNTNRKAAHPQSHQQSEIYVHTHSHSHFQIFYVYIQLQTGDVLPL